MVGVGVVGGISPDPLHTAVDLLGRHGNCAVKAEPHYSARLTSAVVSDAIILLTNDWNSIADLVD